MYKVRTKGVFKIIYQMTIYYGAMLNGEAIYSMKSSLENCTKFPDKLNENVYADQIIKAIKKDGLDPIKFSIGYLTKEQYENRYSKETEKVTTWTINR